MWLATLSLLTATSSFARGPLGDDPAAFGDPVGPLEGMEILRTDDDIPSLVERPVDPGLGVVNGTVDTGNSYDNVVLLAWWDGSFYFLPFCSGTVIDDQWVVTAAHCLEAVEDQDYLYSYGFDFYIFLGSGNNGNYTDAVQVSDFIINPSYNAQAFINDIGLVETTRGMGVPPMVLNDEVIGQPWVGEEMIFVGYGITTDGGNDGGTKRYADIPIIDWDSYNVYSYEPNQNVCQGDSGGAALEQTADGYELAGINAFVSPGCVGGSNGATRVDLFISWIQGYVPFALTGPDDTIPGDTDTDVDTDSDVDVDVDTDSDSDNGELIGEQEPEWDPPSRPKKGQYPLRLRCQTGAVAPASTGLVAMLALLAVGRRRS